MKKVLIIHGPNLNMLGKREPEVYGKTTLGEINDALTARGNEHGLAIETFQSNHEGAIIEKIQANFDKVSGVIINPAAFTHTSVAIRDALLMVDAPVIEVHLSNIYKREPFRHKSMVADIAVAQISGLGVQGYHAALDAIANMVK
ncbi:MAG: type II 3-dehydroquinate dehydratase [Desulfobacterales bacterium]|nr:type II 3-dehydroquinate dehydratase [Desulfobacterales bacterium]